MVGMLEVVLTGEKLARTAYNNSQSKAHYSFPKNKRFRRRPPSYNTEFNYDVKIGKDKKPLNSFSRSKRFGNKENNPTPGPGSYDLEKPRKSQSISFGIGRSVG